MDDYECERYEYFYLPILVIPLQPEYLLVRMINEIQDIWTFVNNTAHFCRENDSIFFMLRCQKLNIRVFVSFVTSSLIKGSH